MKALFGYIAPRGLRRRAAIVGAMAIIGGALFAGSAEACSYPGAEQKFRPWGDVHSYVLAPDGGFESGAAGWTLAGGAAPVAGNETYFLNSRSDSHALALPGGGSAVTPSICMSPETPIIRVLARNTGDPSSKLRVEMNYEMTYMGRVLRTAAVADLTAGPTWAPSREISTVGTLAPVIGAVIPASIKVRFAPLDTKGNWQIDDFYVDPFARH